jgi:polysaccharide chain length determinant protein (PEP-CTERM system associated)
VIPGKRYTPELLFGIARRRKWLILIPTVIVTALACGVTYTLPDVYRSEATVLVVPPQVPENYVRSTVQTNIEDRLRSINQQVRGRSRLERIIEEFNLYADRRKTDIMQDIVEDMSRAIDVDIVQRDVFRVAFTSDNPRTAQQVADKLASFFIDESLKDRTSLAQQTTDFLEQRRAETERKLRATEEQLTEYRRKHDGELPTQENANLQGITSTQTQLSIIASQIERSREQQQTLQRQIPELQAAVDAAAAAPVVAQDTSAPQTKAAQLAAEQAKLKILLARYKPGFPEVDKQQKIVDRLEREAAEEAAGATTLTSEGAPANSLLARRQKELDLARAELEKVTRQIEKQMADQAQLNQAGREYQRRLEAAPGRDNELTGLSRDYGTLKASYDSLTAKLLESQTSASVEQRQIGEQFKMIDQARIPEKPSSPNRPRYYLLSFLLAIGVGLGLAVIGEYFDRGLRSEDDVRLALALPVLATIPVIGNKRKKVSLRWKILGGATAVLVVVAIGAAWLALRG